jgi:hypothetical protein
LSAATFDATRACACSLDVTRPAALGLEVGTSCITVVDGARGSSRSAPTSLGPRATALLDESDDMVQTILILDESDVVYASD